jgi:hypothetical protein
MRTQSGRSFFIAGVHGGAMSFFGFLQFLLSLRHKIPCIGRSSKATFSEEFEAIGLLVS